MIISSLDLQHAVYDFLKRQGEQLSEGEKDAFYSVLTTLDNDESNWCFDVNAPFSLSNYKEN